MLSSLPRCLFYSSSTHYLKSCELLLLCTMYYMTTVEVPVTFKKSLKLIISEADGNQLFA